MRWLKVPAPGSKKDDVYHALRCAYNAGKDGAPWTFALMAMRAGLGFVKTREENMPFVMKYTALAEMYRRLKHLTKP